jgi:2-isopropylmalate synthase
MKTVYLYDTTLRDGTQSQEISLSVLDKVSVAEKLDEFGIHYIEGGYPLSNDKDLAFFHEARRLELKHSKLVAFGMTRRKARRPTKMRGCRRCWERTRPR